MPTVARPRLHHLALTVTDVDASARWYEDVFDNTFQMDGAIGAVVAAIDGTQVTGSTDCASRRDLRRAHSQPPVPTYPARTAGSAAAGRSVAA